MFEDHVKISVGMRGDECFLCEEKMRDGEIALAVSFRIIVPVERKAHLECARDFTGLLDLRIGQALRRRKGH